MDGVSREVRTPRLERCCGGGPHEPRQEERLVQYGASKTSTVYRALDYYPMEDLSGLVVGSQTPWVEAILLVAGQYQPLS